MWNFGAFGKRFFRLSLRGFFFVNEWFGVLELMSVSSVMDFIFRISQSKPSSCSHLPQARGFTLSTSRHAKTDEIIDLTHCRLEKLINIFKVWFFKYISKININLVIVENECNFWRFYGWKVNIRWGNGLVPSGTKPLSQPILTKIFNSLWRHWAIMKLLSFTWNSNWFLLLCFDDFILLKLKWNKSFNCRCISMGSQWNNYKFQHQK